MGEIMMMGKGVPACTPLEEKLIQQLESQQKAMLNMAMLLRETNERMKALEMEVHRMTKVTPQQANTINAVIRQRAKDVCRMHRAEGGENAAAAAIRKSLRQTCGAAAVRDILRSDFQVALTLVQLWDDYRLMEAIKAKL